MTLHPIQRLWSLLRLYKIELRHIYTYAISNGIINLSIPLGIQAIINYIQTGEVTTSWVVLVCIVLLGYGITGAIQVLQLRIVENIQQDLFARSAFEFAFRFPKITFLQLDRIHTPELANRFFDTLTIQKGLPKILIDFSLASFQIVFGLILLAIYSPYFIILGVALVFVLGLIFGITGPNGLQTSLKESKYKYRLAYWLEEIARINGTFKLHASNGFHLEKTDDIVGGYLNSREKHFQVLLNQFQLFIFFKVFVAAGLLLLGGYLVIQNQMNIGQFVAAEIIILLVINSVEKFLRIIDTIYDVLTALEKIGNVTDLEMDENYGSIILDHVKAFSIQARKIVFGFPNASKDVIVEKSFDIPAGAKVRLMGKSGSGKSLLLQILAGIHEVNDGELNINGIPFTNLDRVEYHERIGYAFPTNQLFEGSYRHNIVMGREISERDLNDIVNILGLNEHLAHQPKGIDCPVDSGGRRLPRSIIQRLLIARIMVGNPSLLLLEDPLQFVEEDEKVKIIDYIMSPERSWTVVVVSDFHYWNEKSTQTIDLSA